MLPGMGWTLHARHSCPTLRSVDPLELLLLSSLFLFVLCLLLMVCNADRPLPCFLVEQQITMISDITHVFDTKSVSPLNCTVSSSLPLKTVDTQKSVIGRAQAAWIFSPPRRDHTASKDETSKRLFVFAL
jgi:hypothetical protein